MNILTLLFISLFFLTAVIVVILAFKKTYLSDYSGSFIKVITQMLIFYGVYLMPFVVIGMLFLLSHAAIEPYIAIASIFFALLYIYARLIEPKNLQVIPHHIHLSAPELPLANPIKIALLADLHLGLYDMYPRQLNKIVTTLNKLKDIDAVVFAGDWTYEPEPNMVEQLEPLSQIKHPCYHVLGNHDEQCPGPDIAKQLLNALTIHQVKNIEADMVHIGGIHLVGVGDLWASKAEFQHFTHEQLNAKPCVIVAHNPDTVLHIPDNLFDNKPLMLSGHTHGGQIFIPKLTPWIFKKHSATGYYEGLYQHQKAQVFVTAGLGMVQFPFRINMPPRIDVLTIS